MFRSLRLATSLPFAWACFAAAVPAAAVAQAPATEATQPVEAPSPAATPQPAEAAAPAALTPSPELSPPAAAAQATEAAQPVATPPAAAVAQAPEEEIREIVITAQKREQNVQDVPMAVQVIDAAALEVNGVRDFIDLNRTAPSLSIRPSENPVNNSIAIRGIGTTAFSVGVEPAVAVVVDDVPMSFQARAFSDMADVERIEVLRGPQSTLYGKSASAGLINITTKAPTRNFSGQVTGLATADSEFITGLSLSGPIGTSAGFRSSVNYNYYEGNVDNLATGKEINGRRSVSTRNKLYWDVTDAVNVQLGFDYLNGGNTTGRVFINLSPNARLRGRAELPPEVFAPGVQAGQKNDKVYNDYPTEANYEDVAQSLRVSWDTGGPTLLSITSHDEYKLIDDLDSDGSAIGPNSSVPTAYNIQHGTSNVTQWTQEFRVVSPGDQPVRYTMGLFAAQVEYKRSFYRGPLNAQAEWNATNESTQSAAFAQLDVDVLENTTAIAGARVGKEAIDYQFNDIRNVKNYSGDAKDDYTTYRLALQQDFTRDIMAFVSFATGHKGQAYDLGSSFNQSRADAGPIGPESSKDWQVGTRTQFFKRHLTLNATVFDTRYKDFQSQGIENLPNGTQEYRLTNVGKLRTRGVELESSLVFGNLHLGGGVTYQNARIAEYPFAPCYAGQTVAQGCFKVGNTTNSAQDLGGTRLGPPNWKWTGNFEYSHALGGLPFEGVTRGAYTYQSKPYVQDPVGQMKAYGVANLAAGIRDLGGDYEVMLFVNNLFNEHYFNALANNSGSFGGQTAILGYRPRDFDRYAGIRARYSF